MYNHIEIKNIKNFKNLSIEDQNLYLSIRHHTKNHDFTNLKEIKSYLDSIGIDISYQKLLDINTVLISTSIIQFKDKTVNLLSGTTNNYPITPIEPKILCDLVSNKLKEFKQIVPDKTPKLVAELCMVFNECIKLNSENRNPESTKITKDYDFKNLYKTLVVSPRTGSAKSLTLQAYVSLLKYESSIIVLRHVSDVIEFCEKVNSWSKDSDYARCHYSINLDNLKTKFHIAKNELADFRCIVITHSLFKQLKHQNNFEIISKFDNNKRNLTVIDERIQNHKKYSITFDECSNFFQYISLLPKINNGESNLIDKDCEKITSYIKLFMIIFQDIIENQSKSFEIIFDEVWEIIYNKDDCNLELFKVIINHEIEKKYLFNPNIDTKASNVIKNTEIKKVNELLETMFRISKSTSVLQKSGNIYTLHTIDNCENNFSSQVIMDATAHVNSYYTLASKSIFKNLEHIKITNPKKYDNVTFNIANGYKQGRNSIYKDSSKDILHEVNRYLEMACDILKNEDDNLLILGHKNFTRYLEKTNIDNRIYFTHWGRHIGHNNWSHCNKILVIGWNYLPKVEHYLTIANSQNGFFNAFEDVILKYKNLISTISIHQMVDDLIQGISRSSLRNTIDKDGNCPKTEIFLLYKSTEDTEKILKLMKKEFQGAKYTEWYPKDIGTKEKLTKTQIKIKDLVSKINANLCAEGTEYLTSAQAINMLDIAKSTFHRLTAKPYFQELCQKKNILYNYLDKKTKVFTKK